MLAAVGTSGFFEHGRLLYGEPSAPLRYLPVKPLELAHQVQETIAQLARIHFDIAPPAYHSAAEVAERLEVAVKEHFGDQAPSIDLVDQLSANALATSKAIRIRRDARFTDRDYIQLLHHEAISMSRPRSTARPRSICRSWPTVIPAPRAPRRGSRSMPS
jgi:hypothetical protein